MQTAVHKQQHGQYVVDHNPDSQVPQHVLVDFLEQLSQCKWSVVSARPQVPKNCAGN